MNANRKRVLQASQCGQLSARDMQSHDLTQVLSIEANAQASPWGRLSFEESLTKQHCCRIVEVFSELESAPTILKQSEIIAYHVVCAIEEELHILNVVVAPQYHGLGLGHMLMDDIVKIAKKQSLAKIFLEVRASNQVAQDLYIKWQFKQIGLRKEYYRPTTADRTREDALIFMRKL